LFQLYLKKIAYTYIYIKMSESDVVLHLTEKIPIPYVRRIIPCLPEGHQDVRVLEYYISIDNKDKAILVDEKGIVSCKSQYRYAKNRSCGRIYSANSFQRLSNRTKSKIAAELQRNGIYLCQLDIVNCFHTIAEQILSSEKIENLELLSYCLNRTEIVDNILESHTMYTRKDIKKFFTAALHGGKGVHGIPQIDKFVTFIGD